MIDTAIEFLRDHLNGALMPLRDSSDGPAAPPLVAFVDGEKLQESVCFTLGTVSALLVKLEEENILRPADPFARTTANGSRHRACPEIRLNLFVLFVAHFKQYGDSLRWLSEVVSHFQNHRFFTPANAPALNSNVDQLMVELVTPSFSEQNEIWGALRASYRPSALYRVRMVVFRDEAPTPQSVVEELLINEPA